MSEMPQPTSIPVADRPAPSASPSTPQRKAPVATQWDDEIEALQARLKELLLKRGHFRRVKVMQDRHREDPEWSKRLVASAIGARRKNQTLPPMTPRQRRIYCRWRKYGQDRETALREALRDG